MPTGAQKSVDRQKARILFVHNTLMWYTKPFFVGLSQIYDVAFIFTHMQLGKSTYGVQIPEGNDEFGEIKYKVLRRYLSGISPSGIPFGLVKDLFRERCDVVVATSGSVEMLLCFIAAKLRRKPIVLWIGAWNWRGKSSERSLASPFTKFIVPRSDAVVTPGTKHKEYAISLGASPDRVFTVPYASNIAIKEEDYAEGERLREELGIGDRRVILFVGRLVKQKGVDYVIQAFSELRKEMDDVVLLVVGEGESRGDLEVLSKNLGVEGSIRFAGFVPNAELPPYFVLCDVCAVPSITYGQADVWLRAVNDAMYAGKPVIATDAVGAAFDMIQDGVNGFIVPERDSNALYKALKRVLSEPELARKMGEESKRIVEDGFMYEHMIDGFTRAVDSVSPA